jgi:hypothetical protein
MVDTTGAIAGKIERFNENLAMLHKTVEMTKPVLENMKTVLAVQWFLGNVFMLGMFICTGVVLSLHYSNIKKQIPDYKVKVWYLVGYVVAFALMVLAFNFLPGLGTNNAYRG